MSIAIIGPEKYDLQDLVCIEMMLRFYVRPDAQFRVEPRDGEDAELVLISDGVAQTIEVQVKGSEAPLSLELIAEYLAHFPERRHDSTLLERLLSDPERIVVIVASGRCDDTAAMFLSAAHWQGRQHDTARIKLAGAEELLALYGHCLDNQQSPSALTQRRQKHLNEIARTKAAKDIRNALCRLIVIERVHTANLTSDCEIHLRPRRVPNDAIPGLIARLRDIVKAGKKSQNDIFPLLRKEVDSAGPITLKPVDYVERGDEEDLTTQLRDTGVLLISGSPRTGKTDAARAIAASFETQGYDVREFHEFDVAQRFLLDSADAQRIALLDDPLGGAHAAQNPAKVLHKIGQLVSRLGGNRKLIVVQARDRLLETTRKVDLTQIPVGASRWEDLDNAPKQFLPSLWHHLGKRHEIKEPLFTKVLDALVRGSVALEAGCLAYLAANQARVLDASDLDRIVRLAREDAADLGRSLAGGISTPILIGLAVGTVPGHPIAATELAYLTGKGGQKLPGKIRIQGTITEHGGGKGEKRLFPNYEELPQLSHEELRILDTLELRRIVDRNELHHVTLSHPVFRAAAETLVDAPTRQSEDNLLLLLERALFCLAPKTSRAAARNMDWIFQRTESKHGKNAVVDRAISGLNSIYPSTRDLCFQFLVRHFSDVPDSLRHLLPKWIDKVTMISLSDVEWQDGEAVLPLPDELGLISVGIDWSDWLGEHQEGIFDVFDRTTSTEVTPKTAWEAAKAYAHFPERLTSYEIQRLLSFEESLIRAKSAAAWLAVRRDDDKEILERIFLEEHPALAAAALKGAVEGWSTYDEARRSQVLAGLLRMATSPICAAVMIHKLVVFGRDSRPTQEAPWAIFSSLLPQVLEVIPHGVRFSDARLYDAVLTASKHVSSSDLLAICDSWIILVERIADERIPSDYELGVTSILARKIPRDTPGRERRMARLLALPGTGATIRVVADLASNWDSLSNVEQEMLKAAVAAPRTDSRWLAATVLTRSHVPEPLAKLVLPTGISLAVGAENLLHQLPKELIKAVVCVYVGEPGPLGYIGISHAGEDVWRPVIELIALDPSHELFEAAWDDITLLRNDEYLSNFVSRVSAQDPQRMFDTLFRIKIRVNGDFMPKAWDKLLKAAPDQATRSSWIERMAQQAPYILNGLSEAKDWLSGDNLEELLGHLNNDFLPLQLLLQIRKNRDQAGDTDFKKLTLTLIHHLFDSSPPVLHRTCDQVREYLDDLGWKEPDLLDVIENRRHAIIDQLSRKQSAGSDITLEAWDHVQNRSP